MLKYKIFYYLTLLSLNRTDSAEKDISMKTLLRDIQFTVGNFQYHSLLNCSS